MLALQITIQPNPNRHSNPNSAHPSNTASSIRSGESVTTPNPRQNITSPGPENPPTHPTEARHDGGESTAWKLGRAKGGRARGGRGDNKLGTRGNTRGGGGG